MKTIAALLVAFAPLAATATEPSPIPSLYVMALPTAVSLVAWLPVEGAKDLADLDLRVEVVQPNSCGDHVAGLLRRGGPRLDGPDAYDVVIERRAGDCTKESKRIAARAAIRMRIADGATRELVLGTRTLKVARAQAGITLDGEGPTGDVPGAPPTAKPTTFVTGEVASASIAGVRATNGKRAPALIDVRVSARWPKCAGESFGFLGRGDAASGFALSYFEPVAVAPLDGSCGPSLPRPRNTTLTLASRRAAISVGNVKLAVENAAAKK